MECIYCGAELDWEDSYGNKSYIIYGDKDGKSGDIYRCPNHEGFESKDDLLNYLEIKESDLDKYCKDNGFDSWEEIACESCTHSVSGSFYTDSSGNLYEGYPC